MKNLPVLDMQGKTMGKLPLDECFFDGKVNKPLLQQAVLMYLANQRKGSASTKTRAEVRGGGKKPWRQKGTGRARAGSIRSPLWRGGGVTFGPKPRQYKYALPNYIRNLAIVQSLNAKIKDDELIVVDNISLDQAKTKNMISFLESVKVKDSALMVIEKKHPTLVLASRNIPGITVKLFNCINAHDILIHKQVIFTKPALENLIKLRKQ